MADDTTGRVEVLANGAGSGRAGRGGAGGKDESDGGCGGGVSSTAALPTVMHAMLT